MASYLQRFDATPAAQRWPLVRGWMFNEPLPFYAELRRERPILVMPELTLATRYDDCTEVLLRHDLFSVALYKPKQGDYWMDQGTKIQTVGSNNREDGKCERLACRVMELRESRPAY